MKYFSQRKDNGYTLIEMVITIGIFVIITLVVMNNFRQGQKLDDLRTGSLELASNLREVQTLGLSGQVVNVCKGGDNNLDSCEEDTDCSGGGVCGLVPIGGFGIAIDKVAEVATYCDDNGSILECPTGYTMFADIGGAAGDYEEGDDIILEVKGEYSLPKRVRIIELSVECSWIEDPGPGVCPNASVYGVDISFRPPKPTPYFFVETGGPLDRVYSEQTIRIMVQHADTGKCRMVKVNGISGEVSEDQDIDCTI